MKIGLADAGREKLPELELIAAILEDAIELIKGSSAKAWVENELRLSSGSNPIPASYSRFASFARC